MPQGRLIVFEGVDGVGKTTQVDKVKLFLDKMIPDQWIFSKEPGGTYLGDKIRELLFVEPGTRKLAVNVPDLLFLASHLQNVYERVKPALDKGKIVVCDRWYYSQLVYMQEREVHPDVKRAYNSCKFDKVDLVFFLYGRVDEIFRRANANSIGREHQTSKAWNDPIKLARMQKRYNRVLTRDLKLRPEDLCLVNVDGRDVETTWVIVESILMSKLTSWGYIPPMDYAKYAASSAAS